MNNSITRDEVERESSVPMAIFGSTCTAARWLDGSLTEDTDFHAETKQYGI